MTFGDRLRQLRKEKNISQTELAKDLNITCQALSQYELKKRMPDTKMIMKLADYFNVSLDYFFGRTDMRKPGTTEDDKIKTKTYQIIDASGLCKEDISKVEEYVELLKQKYNPDSTLNKK